MKTHFHTSMRHVSWRFNAILVVALVISSSSNLLPQLTPAIDPFDARPTGKSPSTTTAAELEAAEIEASKLNRIQAMMQRWGDEGLLEESHLKKRLEMIRTYPELGKHLVKIADQMIEQKSPEIGDILDAMSMRPDVPPEATTRYIELTKRIIEGKTAKDIKDGFEQEYLTGIADVLATHLSPENEDLLIALLHVGSKGHAHRALGRVGTIRALPALQKYAGDYERYARTQDDGSVTMWLNDIKKSLTELSKRVSGAEQGTGPMIQPESSAEPSVPKAKPSTAPSEEPTSSTPWSIIVVLIVAAIGLLWLLFMKRK